MIFRSALIILVVTVIGRALGFIRGIFISDEFGVGMETDAYFAAFVIPMTLLMIIPGAIHSVFIPSLNRVRLEEGEDAAKVLFQKVFTFTFVIGAVVSILGVIFSGPIVSALAPGFDGEKKELATELLQWMVPSIFFIGIIGVVSAVLNVKKGFFWPSFGTVVNSVVIIISIYLLAPYIGIHGLAIGTLLGIIGYALIMFPSLIKHKYYPLFKWDFRNDSQLKVMGQRLIPIMIGSFISQITIYAERFLASGLGDAKIAALALAYSLIQAPMALLVSSFVVPLFPLLTEYVAKDNMTEVKKIIEKGFAYLIVVLVPIMIGMFLLNKDIIQFLYERGEFSANDTETTAWALLFYSFAILGMAGRALITRVFYALGNTKTPVTNGIISFGIYLAVSQPLIALFNHGGIALAAGISGYAATLLMMILLWRKIGSYLSKNFTATLIKTTVATLAMVFALGGGNIFSTPWSGFYDSLTLGLSLMISIIIAVIVYFGILIALREHLVFELIAKFSKKLKRKKDTGAA